MSVIQVSVLPNIFIFVAVCRRCFGIRSDVFHRLFCFCATWIPSIWNASKLSLKIFILIDFGTIHCLQVQEFSKFDDAIFTLLRTILGDFDFHAIERADPFLGPLFFLAYVFFVFFVLLVSFDH